MLGTFAKRAGIAAFVAIVSIGSLAIADDKDRVAGVRSEHHKERPSSHRLHDRDRHDRDHHDRDRHDRDRHDRHDEGRDRHRWGHSWHRDHHPGRGHGYGHGYWSTRPERVCVTPGRWEMRYIPAQVHRYYHNGCWHERVICAARYERVWIPPVYETRHVRYWCNDRPSSGFTFRWEF